MTQQTEAGSTGCGLLMLGGLILLLFSCFTSEQDSSDNEAALPDISKEEPLPEIAAPPTSDSTQVDQAEDFVKLLINTNGHLCADVVNVQPLQVSEATFEVTCIEYRGGSGTVRYLVNGETNVASKL